METSAPDEKRITVGLPADLHQWLNKLADKDRRSLRQEIVWLLERVRDSEQQQPPANGQEGKQDGS